MSISQQGSIASKSQGAIPIFNDVVESARLLHETIGNGTSMNDVPNGLTERLKQQVTQISTAGSCLCPDSVLSAGVSVWNSAQAIRSFSSNLSQVVLLEHIACDLLRIAAFAFEDFGVDDFVDIIAKYTSVGNQFVASENFNLADLCFRKAADILRSLPTQSSPRKVFQYLLSHAKFLWTMKTFPRAERLLIKAQHYASDSESAAELLLIVFKLGCVRFNERQAQRAIFWFSKVIELGKLCAMKKEQVNAALLIGICYLTLGQQDQARNSILQAQEIQSHPIARFLLLHIAVAEEESGIERRIRTICKDEMCPLSLCLASIALVTDKQLLHESSIGYSILCESAKCNSNIVLMHVSSLYLQTLISSGKMIEGVKLIQDVSARMEKRMSNLNPDYSAANHRGQWYKVVLMFACYLAEKKMFAEATIVFQKAKYFAQCHSNELSIENEGNICRLLASCAFNATCAMEEMKNEITEIDSSLSISDFIDIAKTNAKRASVLIPEDPTARMLLFYSFLLDGKSELAAEHLEKALHKITSIDAYDITGTDYCKNHSISEAVHIEALESVLKKTSSNLRSSNPVFGLFGAVLVALVKIIVSDGAADGNQPSASNLMRLHASLGSALDTINEFSIELAFGTNEEKKNDALGFLGKVAWNCAQSTINRKMYAMAETFSQVSFELMEQVGLNTDYIDSMRTMRMVQAAALIERDTPEEADYTRAQKCLKDASNLSTELVKEGDPSAQIILLMNSQCCAALGEEDGLQYYVSQVSLDPCHFARVLQPLLRIVIPDVISSVSKQRKEVAQSLLRSVINHYSIQNDRNIQQLAVWHRQLAELELSNIHEDERAAFVRAVKFANENIESYPDDEWLWLASTARSRTNLLIDNNTHIQARWWIEAAIEIASKHALLMEFVPEMKAVLESTKQQIEASVRSLTGAK